MEIDPIWETNRAVGVVQAGRFLKSHRGGMCCSSVPFPLGQTRGVREKSGCGPAPPLPLPMGEVARRQARRGGLRCSGEIGLWAVGDAGPYGGVSACGDFQDDNIVGNFKLPKKPEFSVFRFTIPLYSAANHPWHTCIPQCNRPCPVPSHRR